MNETDVTPAEIEALRALSAAAQALLTAAREAGHPQTEAIAACAVTGLGLINAPAGGERSAYLRRVAEAIFELAIQAEAPRPPSELS